MYPSEKKRLVVLFQRFKAGLTARPDRPRAHAFTRFAAAWMLAVLMVFSAGLVGERELIFPEILALASGAWLAPRCPWRTGVRGLWLLPTAAACMGFALSLCGLPAPLGLSLAFLSATLLLTVTRSTLAPAISAAMLPLLLGTSSWLYPLSVCVLTAVVALGSGLFGSGQSSPAPTRRDELRFWLRLLPVVVLAAWLARASGATFSLAPPLVVLFTESARPQSLIRRESLRALGLVACTSTSGAFCGFVALSLVLPAWCAAGVATLTVFGWFWLFRMALPPAAALALLPLLLSPADLLWYPVQVSIGAGFFLGMAKLVAAE